MKTAITRLCYINNLYNVPSALREMFNSMVWKSENLDDEGLPDLGDFNNVLAIDIPCKTPVNEIKTLFEKSL